MIDDLPKSAGTLAPPRPNLGPEPLEDVSWPVGWGVGLTLVLLGLLVFIGLNRRRRIHQPLATEINPLTTSDQPPSPREELIAQANDVRNALVARFGDAWRAKTTEEIAVEPQLIEAFDAEITTRLIVFLREADRAKFAREIVRETQGWVVWVADFLEMAGASSMTNGK